MKYHHQPIVELCKSPDLAYEKPIILLQQQVNYLIHAVQALQHHVQVLELSLEKNSMLAIQTIESSLTTQLESR